MSEPMSDERLEQLRKIFLDAKVADWYRKELQELFDEVNRLRADNVALSDVNHALSNAVEVLEKRNIAQRAVIAEMNASMERQNAAYLELKHRLERTERELIGIPQEQHG
jgi:hypothetical protein